jgi:hypothetical protein
MVPRWGIRLIFFKLLTGELTVQTAVAGSAGIIVEFVEIVPEFVETTAGHTVATEH